MSSADEDDEWRGQEKQTWAQQTPQYSAWHVGCKQKGDSEKKKEHVIVQMRFHFAAGEKVGGLS